MSATTFAELVVYIVGETTGKDDSLQNEWTLPNKISLYSEYNTNNYIYIFLLIVALRISGNFT